MGIEHDWTIKHVDPCVSRGDQWEKYQMFETASLIRKFIPEASGIYLIIHIRKWSIDQLSNSIYIYDIYILWYYTYNYFKLNIDIFEYLFNLLFNLKTKIHAALSPFLWGNVKVLRGQEARGTFANGVWPRQTGCLDPPYPSVSTLI